MNSLGAGDFLLRQIRSQLILRLRSLLLLVFLGVYASGCGLIFGGDQRVDNKSHDYTVTRLDRDPSNHWRLLPSQTREDLAETGDVAFEHKHTGSIISINSVCREYRDASLEDLSRHLLMGIDTRGPAETREIDIDGAKALESTVDAGMNQQREPSKQGKASPVKIRAVVLQKSGCTYDFMYVAKPEHFEAQASDFDRFLKGFHVN
ncbi:MAG: hypothetical protein AB1540_15665 [Bdellovibrionota bacterium]